MYSDGYNDMRGPPHNDAETRRYSKDSAVSGFYSRGAGFSAALRFKDARLARRAELYRSPQPPESVLHLCGRLTTLPDRYAAILAQEIDRWRIIKDSRTHVRF
jgi:hypothetical protein